MVASTFLNSLNCKADLFFMWCILYNHLTHHQSFEYLADCPQLRAEYDCHDPYFGHVYHHVFALVALEAVLAGVVLGQHLPVLQTGLFDFDQELSDPAGELADVLPARVGQLLLLVGDLEVHVQTGAALPLKAELTLALPGHLHFQIGLVVRPCARLRHQRARVVVDEHVGCAHVGVVVVGEHQPIAVVLHFKPEAGPGAGQQQLQGRVHRRQRGNDGCYEDGLLGLHYQWIILTASSWAHLY
jgi:hypothetical protein